MTGDPPVELSFYFLPYVRTVHMYHTAVKGH